MKMLDLSAGRQSYTVNVEVSLLFECVLGLAAVTYAEIRDSLERTSLEWEEMIARLTPKAWQALEFCAYENTWQALLRLVHGYEDEDLAGFLQHVWELSDEEFRFQSLPPLGGPHETKLRRLAASGDTEAQKELIAAAAGHGFLERYVPFCLRFDVKRFKLHLLELMKSWYQAAIEPCQHEWTTILQREKEAKQAMQPTLSAEAFVEWATGKPYLPEPGIHRVLLVPHIAYRPWTIQADLTDTRVFYYPVSDDSLYGDEDPYRPPASLVLLYKALGDDNRMQLVKLLYERERNLQELTETLGLAKSTIHHHLALLRSAGVVYAKGAVYFLKVDVLKQADKLLQLFLEKGRGGHDEP